ncbi:hypothetical protein Q4566_14000 [Tamlana sp. 2_MG-2023]|uniref:hypothetical protein n=1 Tax=unclassified Tamlana TaxID=2614803 RepID=UPI0026E316D1|nr:MULTISPECIES: hypothetical protein [unclassified Tamlana]MDO6761320.1 hypothetical protein [Tamlana sp. 2_MG-2023]MDO6791803.1 hypothetical protein [Tamlana sp. 1_MG-2023]
MKTYKNIAKYLCIAALTFVGCSDDDNDMNLVEPSHRVIYTSQMDFDNQIEVGNYITFGDVSPGVTSRTWGFPEDVTSIEGNQSNDDIVKAYFNTPGDYNVTLHQVFSDDAYVDETLMGKELDTTIAVRVLGPVELSVSAKYINPDGTIGADLNLADNAQNELQAGRSIRYSYTVAGEPATSAWTFEAGKPGTVENTETIDVKYSRMGTYGVELFAGRDRPFGEDIVTFENLITVIASTDPVTLDAAYNRDSSGGVLNVEFSREIDAATLNASDFTVTATNGGSVYTPAIASASVDSNEGNIVILELADVVYNDDLVTITYTPGTLKTLDQVAVGQITDAPMVFVGANVMDNGSFDVGFENTFSTDWVDLNWGSPWGMFTFNISTAQAYDGKQSGYIEIAPAGGMILGQVDGAGAVTFDVEAGKSYELGVWVYLEELGSPDPAGNTPDVRLYWAPSTNWGVAPNPAFTPTFKTGEWVYSSQIVTFAVAGPTNLLIRGDNQSNSETLKFYMDNLTLLEANLRP